MEGLITGPFARVLETERVRYNTLFAQARQTNPEIDVEAFSQHLRIVVAPIVEEVARVRPNAVSEVSDALFALSLDLIAKDLIQRYSMITNGWSFLRLVPDHVAAAPRLFAGSVTNAVYNLSTTHGARPDQWLQTLNALSKCSSDPSTLLKSGQVAAWSAGMAHYRSAALEVCDSLDPELVRIALGMDARNSLPIASVLDILRTDPWAQPGRIDGKTRPGELQIVARVGAFRGFGGLFISPPNVSMSDGQFVVSDGDASWILIADAFGATFHRIQISSLPQAGLASFAIDKNGRVIKENYIKTFPELQEWTSAACDSTTLAITVPRSHAIHLVALAT